MLSATQIQLFEDCQRKWAFKYLERIQTPTHPGALLGTEVQDTQLDPWLGEGRTFDFTRASGEIAAKLAPLLPPPKSPGLRLRRKFLMPSFAGTFAYQGEFDMWAPDSSCVPGLAGGRPLLGDIKTTSNLAYAKTTESLATDIQAQLYAMDVLVEDDTNELDLVWFYTKTRKSYRAQRVHLRVTDDTAKAASEGVASITTKHVAEQFQRIDEIGARLSVIKQANPKANELPPSPRMCDAYGGCPFRFRCNLAPPTHADAVNQEALALNNPQTTDFLAGLRKQPTAAPLQPAPPGTPPGTPGTHTLLADVPALGASAGVYMNPPTPAAAPPPPPPFTAPPGFVWNGSGFVPAPPPAAIVNTPPSLVAQVATEISTAAGAAAAGLAPALTQPVEFRHTAPPAPNPAPINPPESTLPPAPPVGAAAPAEEKPKAKRGRPAGSKNAENSGVTAADVGIGLEAIVEAVALPKAEFATFLEAWAAKLRGA